MSLLTERKAELIDKFRTHPSDTGSPEVQIALLSERIGYLTEHCCQGTGGVACDPECAPAAYAPSPLTKRTRSKS